LSLRTFSAITRHWSAPVRQLSVENILASGARAAFLATPHEVSASLRLSFLKPALRSLISAGISLPRCRRFSILVQLPAPHAGWLDSAVYGLPSSMQRSSPPRGSSPIPGCYATSVILGSSATRLRGFTGLGLAGCRRLQIRRDGRGQRTSPPICISPNSTKFQGLQLFSHRHTPEILDHTGLSESQLVFFDALLPIARGILSTIYVRLSEPQTPEAIETLYRRTYAGRPMVRIWKAARFRKFSSRTHQFCRHRLRARFFRPPPHCRLLSRHLGKGAAARPSKISITFFKLRRTPDCNETRHQSAGALLESDSVVRELAAQVAALAKQGHEILVVHGGGRILLPRLSVFGIESKICLRPPRHGSRDTRRCRHGFSPVC